MNITETHQNGIIWVELDQCMFDFHETVYICCAYITPSNSTVIDTEHFYFFDEIESGLEKYKQKGKCFITGDLNSRTSNVSDVLDFDMYADHGLKFVNIQAHTSKVHVIDRNGHRLIQVY